MGVPSIMKFQRHPRVCVVQLLGRVVELSSGSGWCSHDSSRQNLIGLHLTCTTLSCPGGEILVLNEGDKGLVIVDNVLGK